MKRTYITTALAALGLVASMSAGAVVVSLSPSSQQVSVGDVVTVDVNVSGLGTEIVSGFDFNVFFDAGVLGGPSISFNFADLGEDLPGDWFALDSSGPGNLDAFGFSFLLDDDLAAVQTDDAFRLMTFSFTASADGVTNLGFGADVNFERNLVGRNAQTLAATYGGACIGVGQGSCLTVPEPASYALVLTALAASGLARRRSKPRD